MGTADCWKAGFTRRWHVHSNLSYTHDRVDGHSARVAILIMKLFPDASSDLVKAAVLHDLGEGMVGDLPYPTKMAHPELNDVLERLEAFAIEEMGLKMPELHEQEKQILALCDRVDAYLWAIHHERELVMQHPQWMKYKGDILTRAREFGVEIPVNKMMQEVFVGSY